jgi:hypothetical protein
MTVGSTTPHFPEHLVWMINAQPAGATSACWHYDFAFLAGLQLFIKDAL